ncbi:MAG: hypothetical protein AAF985_05010, partial [Bacteroidota bacterium]
KWIKKIEEHGGEILLQLSEGTSPFGYQYDPDYFVLSSWDNEMLFKQFQQEMRSMQLDNVQHINEFIVE